MHLRAATHQLRCFLVVVIVSQRPAVERIIDDGQGSTTIKSCFKYFQGSRIMNTVVANIQLPPHLLFGWWACVILIGLPLVTRAQVPVHQEPRHRPVFQNDALRVLDVEIKADDTTLDHIHNNDIAIVCISGCDLRTRLFGGTWGDANIRNPGETTTGTYSGHPATHAHQNIGSSFYRAVSVENLRPTGSSQAEPATGPGMKIVNKSRAFLIYDLRLVAGTSPTRHIHTSPTVTVLITGDEVVSSGHAQHSKPLDHSGSWDVIPPGEAHTLSTKGNREVQVIEVEVR